MIIDMKKIYKKPEMSIILLGDENLDGSTQNRIGANANLPGGDVIGDGGYSDPGDDPVAKKFNLWDDWEMD